MTSAADAGLVVLDVAVVVVAARALGAAFARAGQPRVVGEILTGFLLGPSLLGAFPGDPSAALFPADVRPALKDVGSAALAVFMFLVGLGFDRRLLGWRGRVAATISLSAIALPFASGLALAVVLHGRHGVVDGEEVSFAPFALFLAVSMSITAFPVLARILDERGLSSTHLGSLALAAAAADDVLGWSLLAVALAVASAEAPWTGPAILAGALLYALALVLVVRPWLADRLDSLSAARREAPGPAAFACVLAGVAASAAITEAIGIHFVFGAFLLGVALPRDAGAPLLDRVRARLAPPARLLLPVYFVVPGLSVDVGALGGRELGELVLILVVASAGKFAGAAGSAVLQGVGRREALALGALLNTRGLMEIVVLTIGLDAGIIDDTLFTQLIVMALVTTAMTAPLLRLIGPADLDPGVAGTAPGPPVRPRWRARAR